MSTTKQIGLTTFSVSLFTSTTVLSKSFTLTEHGNLIKSSGGQLFDGTVETRTFNNISEFAAMLGELTPHNALAYGLCGYAQAQVVSREKFKCTTAGVLPLITRTGEYFSFLDGPPDD